MLVFGDLETLEPAHEGLDRCGARFRAALSESSGPTRHAALINAYIETGRLAQGCVDAEFASEQADALTPMHEAAIAALRDMARVLARSWASDHRETGAWDDDALARLRTLAPARPVTARVAEGFAFYALFPEACFQAPRNEGEECVVIGVRSIGTALAPLLAEALNASLCFTVRPSGHPFARVCHLAPDLRDLVRARSAARFCIIDEGPGLSGSSFGSVADALEEIGVARGSIEFFPSHDGEPGAASSAIHRQNWAAARRHTLETRMPERRALAGFDIARDMSGGLWREGNVNHDAPANRPYERRKFLARDAQGEWLVKFTGLGDIGERKARMAQTLAHAGFTPAAGPRSNGFLAQRFIADARRIDAAPRPAIIERIADYIAFRARNLLAVPTGGASVEALHRMACCNIGEGLGEETAAPLERFAPRLPALARMERIMATDNRLQAWEWLVDESGAILKCDAVDHCAGHDLVGCRDAAWDVAGAIVEFAMTAREAAQLVHRLTARGVGIAPLLLEFYLVAYCAFHLGAAATAADANASWPQDAQRWRAQQKKYETILRALPALAPA